MYKTLENTIRLVQKSALDEEVGKASEMRMRINAVARKKDSRDGEVPTRQNEIQNKVVGEAENKKKMKVGREETEVIIDPEVDSKASGNQMKEEKDEREYGYEGEMATSQLKSIIQNAEAMLGMLQDGTDLPEWVQSKITLAQDYIMSAKDYLSTEMSEEIEQVDETSFLKKMVYALKSAGQEAKLSKDVDKALAPGSDLNTLARGAVADKILQKRKRGTELLKRSFKNKTNEEIEQIDEKLKGKQHKLDANKNQKIDAHDFELLRKKKKFAESNGVTDSLLDAVNNVVEARKPGQSMQKALDIVAKQKKLQDTLAGKSPIKKEPEVKKEEVNLSDDELARLESIAKKFD